MALITIRDLSISYRGPALLDAVSCQIESGDRIGLLGRNGAGKTTLLRILCGQEQPDSGEVQFNPRTKVSILAQDVPHSLTGSIFEIVTTGLGDDPQEPKWKREILVQQILSRMNLDADSQFDVLSSGMKRRVLLARALVSEPELLLLDEPTNHLDIDAITWLERFLDSVWRGTLIFVTHDRAFLRNLANRILEIDRGRLFDWTCDYDTFLSRKAAALEAEEKQNALFDKRLSEEEAWIRQGIKARRTRNEGRVRALEQMRRQRSQRQMAPDKVNLRISQGERSGNLVADIEGVSFAYDDVQIVHDFTTKIMRGDKVGIIGSNGTGKTTLLQLLLGKLAPQQGRVRLGTNVRIAYFDQLREQLDDNQTVQESIGDGSDFIHLGGKSKHVLGYLQDFLFTPERARTAVRFLSGGERNRVLLARLFAKPANVIVLDEPTNDLDSETLELLEERLAQFEGTLLLVSHDREFINNVVSSTIVFEHSGVREYVGGYDDWLRQRPKPIVAESKSKREDSERVTRNTDAKRRISYQEQQELAKIPAMIDQLESEIAELHSAMAQPEFYQQPGDQITAKQTQLNALQDQLAVAYQRWEELEAIKQL